MVFFVCSHCGASIKKNRVEKHYSTQCFNAPSLSCMDCLKDFRGNEYVAHVKCISEEEKYSAKGFVPKPTSNKGERKQNNWMNIIRSIDVTNIPKDQKVILEVLKKFDNVPQTRQKLENFLRNSFRQRLNMPALDNVWEMLSKKKQLIYEKTTDSTSEKVLNGSKDVPEKNKSENDETTSVVKLENGHLGESFKLSKKHIKQKKDYAELNVVGNDCCKSSSNTENTEEKGEKKMKRGKRKEIVLEKYNGCNSPSNNVENSSVEKTEGKRKKRKRKQHVLEDNIESITNVQDHKRKKSGKELVNIPDVNSVDHQQTSNKELQVDLGNPEEFKWQDEMLNILSSAGHQLLIKKMRKKVIEKFKVHNNTTLSQEELTALFNEKLRTIPNVQVQNKIVSLLQ